MWQSEIHTLGTNGRKKKKTVLMLHKWVLVAQDEFPVTASCMIQKVLYLTQLRSEGDRPHETTLENSEGGFRDDGDTMSKMKTKTSDTVEVGKSMSVHSHRFI